MVLSFPVRGPDKLAQVSLTALHYASAATDPALDEAFERQFMREQSRTIVRS
jgi:hypothetical protein